VSRLPIRNGRLGENLNEAFLRVNQSIDFDRRLYREDIRGSIAYAGALQKRGILTKDELGSIVHGLESIKEEIEKGGFSFRAEDEDIHMNIERRLFELIGETAYKLHTGRSRNEQVVLDERLYLIEVVQSLDRKLALLFKALLRKAKHCLTTIIPSYTHLRQAQAVSLAHIFLAYYHALGRDRERLKDFEKRLKILPLGSGAVAGSSFGVDRDFLKRKLGFAEISRNSIDAVSTRDHIVEFEFICVSIFVTLSRISEDIIIFSSEEFGYYELPDELSTTSSLLPQKKNPDSLELIRGKTARVVGNLLSIITLLKGLPYTYNRDLQEDKEGLFDTVSSCFDALDLMAEIIKGIIINEDAINRILEWSRGKLFATDIADYLVGKGVSFREAHRIVGAVVRYANEKMLHLKDIPLQKYRKFCPRFNDDVYGLFDYIRSVNTHDVQGGTALKRVAEEIKRVEEELKKS
jgi:argininosuccinate lyase